MEGGKTSLNRTSKGDVQKSLQKETSLKRRIGEITVANDILKKHWKEAKDDCSKKNEKQGQKLVIFLIRA